MHAWFPFKTYFGNLEEYITYMFVKPVNGRDVPNLCVVCHGDLLQGWG
jgi:hypothetical protein